MATQTLVRPARLIPAQPVLAPRTTTFRVGAAPQAGRAPQAVRAAQRPSGGVRITRRGRLALLLALTVLALVVVAVIQAGAPAVAGTDSGGAVTRTVVVEPGQTLWQIAREIRPGVDPRLTVARIQELNGLTTVTVWAGQPLVVPA